MKIAQDGWLKKKKICCCGALPQKVNKMQKFAFYAVSLQSVVSLHNIAIFSRFCLKYGAFQTLAIIKFSWLANVEYNIFFWWSFRFLGNLFQNVNLFYFSRLCKKRLQLWLTGHKAFFFFLWGIEWAITLHLSAT